MYLELTLTVFTVQNFIQPIIFTLARTNQVDEIPQLNLYNLLITLLLYHKTRFPTEVSWCDRVLVFWLLTSTSKFQKELIQHSTFYFRRTIRLESIVPFKSLEQLLRSEELLGILMVGNLKIQICFTKSRLHYQHSVLVRRLLVTSAIEPVCHFSFLSINNSKPISHYNSKLLFLNTLPRSPIVLIS